MKTQIICKKDPESQKKEDEELPEVYQDSEILIRSNSDVIKITESGNVIALILGFIYGEFKDGVSRAITPSEIKEKVKSESVTKLRSILQGSYILLKKEILGWIGTLDGYGSQELFYNSNSRDILATDLSLLGLKGKSNDYDPAALIHSLVVYGYRPPKEHTIYKSIRKIGVKESFNASNFGQNIEQETFKGQKLKVLDEDDINLYADAFLEALKLQGSENGNIVYLSSGWDSTSILAGLKHIFGASKVKCVIGRMIYSERRGVINQFEIDRAVKMTEYFGVPLSIVDFNYKDDFSGLLEKWLPLAKDRLTYSLTYLNHSILSEKAASIANGGETIFAGEISDGAHNLGFSQYATYFHPVIEFREYFDKMSNYLMGPSFLNLLYQGNYESDPIFKTIAGFNKGLLLDPLISQDEQAINMQLLSSLFLRADRMPLTALSNSSLTTQIGNELYSNEMETCYLRDAALNMSPDNIYSHYLNLYNSFHWQGATVRGIGMNSSELGFQSALPFWDKGIQEFLSVMPETFGRGLDLNPTKYPLKWTLKNRIDYPMEYQAGPHSYLYDVDQTFNHSAEFLYGCALKDFFKEKLSMSNLESILDDQYFDLGYIQRLIERYQKNEEDRGSKLNDLMSLLNFSMQID